MNTEHGYHIDGTHRHSAKEVKACGGPRFCYDCKGEVEAEQYRRETNLEVATLKPRG